MTEKQSVPIQSVNHPICLFLSKLLQVISLYVYW